MTNDDFSLATNYRDVLLALARLRDERVYAANAATIAARTDGRSVRSTARVLMSLADSSLVWSGARYRWSPGGQNRYGLETLGWTVVCMLRLESA